LRKLPQYRQSNNGENNSSIALYFTSPFGLVAIEICDDSSKDSAGFDCANAGAAVNTADKAKPAAILDRGQRENDIGPPEDECTRCERKFAAKVKRFKRLKAEAAVKNRQS